VVVIGRASIPPPIVVPLISKRALRNLEYSPVLATAVFVLFNLTHFSNEYKTTFSMIYFLGNCRKSASYYL